MWTYLARGLPWWRLCASAVLVLMLLAAVRLDAWTLWPLEGVAVALLAGTTGWCLDEPSAAVVDTTPRGLTWRTSTRFVGVVALLAVWCIAVVWSWEALFGHADIVLLQGLCAATVATAYVTWRRARHEATPGHRWALAVVPIGGAWALVRPFEEFLPVFPYAAGGPNGDWPTSALIWTIAALAAAAVLFLVLAREGRRWERLI